MDFVGIPPFLRIALRVAMAAMHFHITETGLFLEEKKTYFCNKEVQGNTLAPIRNCSGGVR